jgi:hypothetical protein
MSLPYHPEGGGIILQLGCGWRIQSKARHTFEGLWATDPIGAIDRLAIDRMVIDRMVIDRMVIDRMVTGRLRLTANLGWLRQ